MTELELFKCAKLIAGFYYVYLINFDLLHICFFNTIIVGLQLFFQPRIKHGYPFSCTVGNKPGKLFYRVRIIQEIQRTKIQGHTLDNHNAHTKLNYIKNKNIKITHKVKETDDQLEPPQKLRAWSSRVCVVFCSSRNTN